MFVFIRPHVTILALLTGLLISGAARATPSDDQPQAAALFDQGVHEFALHNYESAAKFFLAADALKPSRDALTNALTAALRSEQELLIARAAQRVLQRVGDMTPQTVRRARKQLADTEPRLARLDASCAPAPCSVLIDGERSAPGITYVAAGKHELAAEADGAGRAVQSLHCEAGALCTTKLELLASEPALTSDPSTSLPERSAPTADRRAPAADTVRPVDSVLAHLVVPDAWLHRERADDSSASWLHRERVPLAALLGLGTAAVTLGALTTWSGLEALAARDESKTSPRTYDPAEVRHLARRTDLLLAGTLVFAVAAGATAIWWVDFRATKSTSLSIVPARGLTLLSETRF